LLSYPFFQSTGHVDCGAVFSEIDLWFVLVAIGPHHRTISLAAAEYIFFVLILSMLFSVLLCMLLKCSADTFLLLDCILNTYIKHGITGPERKQINLKNF
jgi:hypothetical protein